MARYYDLVLGLIPLALGGIAAVLVAAGFALTTAIPIAASVSVGLIGHAMFVNGPVEESAAGSAADAGFQSAD
jgi:hypothetical protein